VQKFLENWTHPWLGLETLAIMFSLPYALLMWGMVSFLMAFAFMCLQDSGVATRSVILTLCGIILILIVWCIWTSWKKQESSNADKPKRTTLTFEEDHAKRKQKSFEFTRDDSDTKPQPTKRPARRRSMTLSSLTTTLTVPLKKFRRNSSKNTVVEPVDETEKSSS